MTEFSEIVENQRILIEAEEWGDGIRYIHANNGIVETKYQNGDMHYEDTKTAKKWTVYANHYQGTLVQKFMKWVADRRHYGK